jgi:hypothetical protein
MIRFDKGIGPRLVTASDKLSALAYEIPDYKRHEYSDF